MILAAEVVDAAAQAVTLAKANQAASSPSPSGIGAAAAALSVGIVGNKAAEGVALQPRQASCAAKILVQAILGMALAGEGPRLRRHLRPDRTVLKRNRFARSSARR